MQLVPRMHLAQEGNRGSIPLPVEALNFQVANLRCRYPTVPRLTDLLDGVAPPRERRMTAPEQCSQHGDTRSTARP